MRVPRKRGATVRCLLSFGLASAIVVAVGPWVSGCGSLVDDLGEGVGDPCVPHVEHEQGFPGFALSEISLETGSPSCQTGTCLINHFQGRVSCPGGQSEPVACSADQPCPDGQPCTDGLCLDSVWPQACSVPGTSVAVTTPVCGQCSDRPATDAVYCTCRCGLAEGQPAEGQGPFCRCPVGFQCREIRPYLGELDDHAGKYCVRESTEWSADSLCGLVSGYWEPRCRGVPDVSDGP
ncbi:MAG: hypothetical protein JRI23_21320 [Deltaproteobacteria bacterium]|jgi:hypothetical protein|nr:hypothetical protein [Deltaproteobacteria bacterium]MBW2534483.1 hypothetical protein [Deltaproteobacteria bacterium]